MPVVSATSTGPVALPAPCPRPLPGTEHYQDEWGVWHDTDGRPRPAPYLRQPGNAPLADPDSLDPWLVGCATCGTGLPVCACRHRRLARYTIPDGPWYYRFWVWWVVHLCG